MLDILPIELLLAGAIILFGAYLNGSLGFGMGMLSAPLLALVNPIFVPGPVLITGLLVTVFGVVRDRSALDVRETGWALAGRVPGTALGAAAVASLSGPWLGLAISISVLTAVAMGTLGFVPRRHAGSLFAAGAVSGLFATLAAVGGPPMVLIWQSAPAIQRRAALALFFLIGTFMSLGALLAVGALDRRILLVSLALTPACIAGFALGAYSPRLKQEKAARAAALIMCAFAGFALFARSLGTLFATGAALLP
jgi:uncharacterized membrane protein YfcA